MATTVAPARARDLGAPASDCALPGADRPYVPAIVDKIARDAAALQAFGFGVAAVRSDDAASQPQDGFAPAVAWPPEWPG